MKHKNVPGRNTSRCKSPKVEKSLAGKEQNTDKSIVSTGKVAQGMFGQVGDHGSENQWEFSELRLCSPQLCSIIVQPMESILAELIRFTS